MSGHTPGPWKFDHAEDGIFGAEGAHVTTFGDTYPHDCTPKAEDMALILAAPGLLEALESAVSDLFYQVEMRHGAEAASRYPSIVSARTAIARAKGEL